MKDIIYNGQEIIVYKNQYEGDTIVITFAPLRFPGRDKYEFWGEKPLDKLKIPAIGVTTESDYWYISDEESEWLPIVQKIISDYKYVIIIGYSMGGHPAIRLSKALGADVVLALAPQWSIDKDECDDTYLLEKYTKYHFRENMRGMGLKESQAGGKIFLAYDPYDKLDVYHASRIKSEIPAVNEIKLFHVGHFLIDYLKGARNFHEIIAAAERNDTALFINTISRLKRRHPATISLIIDKFREKKPLLCYYMLNKLTRGTSKIYDAVTRDTQLVGKVSYSLRLNNYLDQSISILQNLEKTLLPFLGDSPRDYNIEPGKCYNLMSYHGYMLVYDMRSQTLCGGDLIFPNKDSIPVYVTMDDRNSYLKAKFNHIEYYLINDGNKVLFSKNYDKDTVFRLIESHNKDMFYHFNSGIYERGFIISNKQGLCMIWPEGHGTIDSPRDLTYESFILYPVRS